MLILKAIWAKIKSLFFRFFVKWLQESIPIIQEKIKMKIAGAFTYLKKVDEGVQEIARHLSRTPSGKWHETIVKRVAKEDVPEHIRRKVGTQEMQMTDDVKRELELVQ